MAADRTISTPVSFPIPYLKGYAPKFFREHVKNVETLKIGVPIRVSQKTCLSRIVCAACVWVYNNGKRAPRGAKIGNLLKIWLDTRPKMETHEPSVYPTILGGVFARFFVSVLRFGRHFLALENGNFRQKLLSKCCLWVYNAENLFLGSGTYFAPEFKLRKRSETKVSFFGTP